MAREHNYGNKQGLKPLPILILSQPGQGALINFQHPRMRIVDRAEARTYLPAGRQRSHLTDWIIYRGL